MISNKKIIKKQFGKKIKGREVGIKLERETINETKRKSMPHI